MSRLYRVRGDIFFAVTGGAWEIHKSVKAISLVDSYLNNTICLT